MRWPVIIGMLCTFFGIYIINAALEWARRGPVRVFPNGVGVWYGNRHHTVLGARYFRGRWWYKLDGLDILVRQEDLK